MNRNIKYKPPLEAAEGQRQSGKDLPSHRGGFSPGYVRDADIAAQICKENMIWIHSTDNSIIASRAEILIEYNIVKKMHSHLHGND